MSSKRINDNAANLEKEQSKRQAAGYLREQASRDKANPDDYPGDLTWENIGKIQASMIIHYPSISCGGYKNMSELEIISKITALPGFKGEKEPPNCMLASLIASGCIITLDP
ncbi:MAG: hypothetical protein FWB95_07505 [Treponema sp.]|nr:hypothetical protein [Treponema sp.]